MGKKILVIDDDNDILEAIRIILEDSGYEIITSDNPDIVKTLTDGNCPNLVLLDILLSGEDGRKICISLKADPKLKNIPVIMMSAHVDVKDSILACGADGFIAKPFAIDELLDILNLHLNSNGSKKIS